MSTRVRLRVYVGGVWYPETGERLAGGLVVRSAYRHDGSARLAVHQLKYRAAVGWAPELASSMVDLLPPDALVLVPIRRARTRLARYGVDPAYELARAAGHIAGLPTLDLIIPPWWSARHAGRPVAARRRPSFRARSAGRPGIVLIDDVVTTGETLAAAARALPQGVVCAVTATAA